VLKIKRLTFVGATLFIGGILLLGFVHLATANYVSTFNGWDDPERFQISRDELGLKAPYYLSFVFMIPGLILLLLDEIKIALYYLSGKNEEEENHAPRG